MDYAREATAAGAVIRHTIKQRGTATPADLVKICKRMGLSGKSANLAIEELATFRAIAYRSTPGGFVICAGDCA
jgi:hypothetical protein